MMNRPVGRTGVRRDSPSHERDHAVVLRDRDAAQLDVARRATECRCEGRVVAQDLFDRAGHELRPRAELRHDVRELREDADRVDDEAGRRLVASDEQQAADEQQIFFAELAVFRLGVDEPAEQVVFRLGTQLVEPRLEVAVELAVDVIEGAVVAHHQHHPDVLDDRVGPALERRHVAIADAEHVRDYHDRQRIREAGDDIDVAIRRTQLADELITVLLHGAALEFDHARRERLRDQAAKARVHRRVIEDHARPCRLPGQDIDADFRREGRRVAEDAQYVVVARDGPEARRPHLHDRRVGAQPGEEADTDSSPIAGLSNIENSWAVSACVIVVLLASRPRFIAGP